MNRKIVKSAKEISEFKYQDKLKSIEGFDDGSFKICLEDKTEDKSS